MVVGLSKREWEVAVRVLGPCKGHHPDYSADGIDEVNRGQHDWVPNFNTMRDETGNRRWNLYCANPGCGEEMEADEETEERLTREYGT